MWINTYNQRLLACSWQSKQIVKFIVDLVVKFSWCKCTKVNLIRVYDGLGPGFYDKNQHDKTRQFVINVDGIRVSKHHFDDDDYDHVKISLVWRHLYFSFFGERVLLC